MAELFANPTTPGVATAITTLGAAITTTTATTITVNGAAPSSLQTVGGQFRILIDQEIMVVTGGANTTTWTVARGAAAEAGVTASTHANGANIYHVLSAGALRQLTQATNNLSDIQNPTQARINLGLGTAATQNISAFDSAGTSASETTRATAAEALLAPLASPAFTGNPTAPTQVSTDNSTKLATTAYVHTLVSGSGGSNLVTSSQQPGTSYTFALTDAGTVVEFTSGSPIAATIPSHSQVAFQTGSIIEVLGMGGQVGILGNLPTLVTGQRAVTQNQGNGSLTSFTVTLNGVTAGHTLLLRATCGSALGAGAFTVSDNVGGVWTSQYAPVDGTYFSDAFWISTNNPGGNVTVTVGCAHAPDGAGGGFGCWLTEWINLGTLDQSTITKATSTTMANVAITPTVQAELVVIAGISPSGAPSALPASPWINDAGAQTFGVSNLPIAYQTVLFPVGETASWTVPSGAWHTLNTTWFGANGITIRSDGNLYHTAAANASIRLRCRAQDDWVYTGDLA